MTHIAIYRRVSSGKQDTASQIPDLDRWCEAHANGTPIVVYEDTFTGKTMDRPEWKRLEAEIRAGRVSQLVVWRLDRLGRTAAGLTRLLEELPQRGVGFVSHKDGIDLSTPAGRLMANVLASVAQYETEVRGERVQAGQAAARAKGKRWGGSKKGRRLKMTEEKQAAARQLFAGGMGMTKSEIARQLGVNRATVARYLNGE